MARNRKIRGFTLIELLVVVAIIALLVSILLPSLSKAREQAKMVTCGSDLKQLAYGLAYCWEEYGAYPKHDDGATCGKSGHFNRMATWVDVLYARKHMGNVQAGYCPSDRRPDPLNRSHGQTWGFRYPRANYGGADYSYAINVILSGYGKGTMTPDMDFQMERQPSQRVVAAEGWWTLSHGFCAQALLSNRFDDPYWGSNGMGWRHGTAKRPGAQVAYRDSSVRPTFVELNDRYKSGKLRGVRTYDKYYWRPGEHTFIGWSSSFNTIDINENAIPGSKNTYPLATNSWNTTNPNGPNYEPKLQDIDPDYLTTNEKWPGDLYFLKGWIRR